MRCIHSVHTKSGIHSHLLELVDSENASSVSAVGTNFLSETRGDAAVPNRQFLHRGKCVTQNIP